MSDHCEEALISLKMMKTSSMESKEEISDTDSGIILHSGPDSPTSPVKDLTTHTRAMKLKQQSLEDRLELCLLELKKICIREAELTGQLSSDYPLTPDEKPPRVHRRIGAAFKLDTGLMHRDGEDPELQALEADLALQLQIVDASGRLHQEENLSKTVRKSRLQQCRREERKAKDLREAVSQHRVRHGCASPPTGSSARASHKDPCLSDDSSLSDVVALDDDMDCGPLSPPPLSSSPSSDLLKPSVGGLLLQQGPAPQTPDPRPGVEYQRSPIQNSPWRESSLDQPYLKPGKPLSASSSRSSSPVGTLVCPNIKALPCHFPSVKNLALGHAHSSSAPSTPELHIRRQYSQSFRHSKTKPSHEPDRLPPSDHGHGRARLPQRRRVSDLLVRSPQFSSPQRRPPYQSSSEDSSSEHSLPSHTGSPSRDLCPTEIPKLCPPPYGFHFGARNQSPSAFGGSGLYKANQPQASPSYSRAMGEGPLSPCSPLSSPLDMGKLYLSPPPRSGTRTPRDRAWPPQQDGVPPASPQRGPKPPPPYTRLVRTPSLREYPGHAGRALPREMVCDELKSWHQRNQFQKSRSGSLERQGSFRVTSPTSSHLPPYSQGPRRVVLQRAPDGTPVQWFVEEDSEIVSQV